MIVWIIVCCGLFLWILVINFWLILILLGWKCDRSNKLVKFVLKWLIVILILVVLSDLIVFVNLLNWDIILFLVNLMMICLGIRVLVFILLSKKEIVLGLLIRVIGNRLIEIILLLSLSVCVIVNVSVLFLRFVV